MPAHLHLGPSQSRLGPKPSIPGRRRWLWKEATPEYCWLCTAAPPRTPPPVTRPTCGHSSTGPLRKCCCGGQSEKKAVELLLPQCPSENAQSMRSKHGRIRKGGRSWHQVRGNLSISPTCASLHSSPSPRPTHALVTASF